MTVLVLATLLTGCGTTTVTQTQPTFIAPPELLLQDCRPIEPPTEEQLLNANHLYGELPGGIWEARTLLLVDRFNGQTQRIADCNLQLRYLREWLEHQSRIFQTD